MEQVRYAAVGPDGALYAVDTGSVVTQLVRRTPVRFRSKLQGTPAELYGTMGGSLLAHLAGNKSTLEVLGSDQPPASTPLPAGRIATSLYGDLVAVAADTAVVIYDPTAKRAPLVVRVPGHARDVMFSPSGHRIYVARDDRDLLDPRPLHRRPARRDRAAWAGTQPPGGRVRAMAPGPAGRR